MTAGYWGRRRHLDPFVTTAETRSTWANGRNHYRSFVVHVTGSAADTLAELAESVGGFDCVRPASKESLHIAVKDLGFVVDEAAATDEIDPDSADAIADAAADIFAREQRFEVTFPRLNVLPNSVFAEVDSDGRFERLHRELLALPGAPTLPGDGDAYTPHATLGEFRSTSDFQYFVEWLEEHRDVDADPFEVEAFSLVEVDPTLPFPPFDTLRSYELEE